jgi:hypothetical protein
MGHLQPETPVHCNNAMVVGIANNTIKRQHSQSMKMHFFWIGDKATNEMNTLNWHTRQENLADYQSKHHAGLHHVAVRPCYLNLKNPPRVLPQVERPRALKGCVGTLKDGYVCKVPLPQAPQIQHASHASHMTRNTCYLAQVPRIPRWGDL